MSTSGTHGATYVNILLAGRIAMAASAMLTPRLALKFFRVPPSGADSVLFGMFGIRNAILASYLFRVESFSDPRKFLAANVAADTFDAIVVANGYRRKELSAATAVIGVGIAGFAATIGALAYMFWVTPEQLDE